MKQFGHGIQLFDQTVMSDAEKGTYGDCTRACIRTVAQQSMPSLPHPIDPKTGHWNDEFFLTLIREYGYTYNFNPYRKEKDWSWLPPIIMAAGPTIRTKKTGNTHLVVWNRESMSCVHDPHPTRVGLLKVTQYCWLERAK